MVLAPFTFAKSEIMAQNIPFKVGVLEGITGRNVASAHVGEHSHRNWLPATWHLFPALMFAKNLFQVFAVTSVDVFARIEKRMRGLVGKVVNDCHCRPQVSFDGGGFDGQ